MSPRPIETIIASLVEKGENEGSIITSFKDDFKELYTHPREDINNAMNKIKDSDIFLIRDEMFLQCLDAIEPQKFLEKNIFINEDNVNLRKRYKAVKCYDDIYLIAISIIENNLHKDIAKTVISSTPPRGQEEVLTQAETAIIKELVILQMQ